MRCFHQQQKNNLNNKVNHLFKPKMKNMKKVKIIVLCAFGAFLFMSCGTGKKLTAANAQIDQLNSQVGTLNSKVAENEKVISQLKTENIQYGKEAQECRELKATIARKKENLQKNLAERGTSVQEIEDKAQAAVRKFREAGCEVNYENGRFHIIVADSFSYKTGSYSVGPRGREALNVVAQVMYDNPGVQTMIVGHTDTVSAKGIADNWSLSTERALAVVRVLEDLYNVNPNRLIAAGRSKFNPIASNDTPEGRAKNRRIEILIDPQIDRLWKLMDE
jgi:chemotaxis protein MotB